MITAEQRTDPAETAAIAGLPKILDDKEIIAVSSSQIYSEVLEADLTDQQKATFEAVTRRRSVVQIKDPTKDIQKLAGEIRSFYKKQGVKAPSGPDSVHLATAIYYECDAFYTTDAKDKKDSCGLLKLTNPIAGKYVLTISRPVAQQGGFPV